jgi:hypothetical protein
MAGLIKKSTPTETVGTIKQFAGTSAPSGWAMCDGTAVNRSTFAKFVRDHRHDIRRRRRFNNIQSSGLPWCSTSRGRNVSWRKFYHKGFIIWLN